MIIGINGRIGAGKDTLGKAIQFVSVKDWPYYKKVDLVRLMKLPLDGFASGWQIKKYATKLKQIAGLLLGVDPIKFEDQDYKNSVLGPEWNYFIVSAAKYGERADKVFASAFEAGKYAQQCDPGSITQSNQMTVREFLQKLGTDAMRFGLHQNTWVNALMADYKSSYISPERNIVDLSTPTERNVITMLHLSEAVKEVASYPNWIITDVRFPNEAQAIKNRGGIVVRIERPDNPYPKSEHESETALDNWEFDRKIVNESIEKLLWEAQGVLSHTNLLK